MAQQSREGRTAVVWGAGSKGVMFLNALTTGTGIEYVVDLNPRKHGRHVPGTGQEVVPPEFLADHRPDVIVVINAIYEPEIRAHLARLRLPRVELLTA